MAGKVNLFDAVPVRVGHVKTEWEDECVVLAFPRFKRAWTRRLFLPKGMSPDIHVPLEEHGTAVWQSIDGQRTVRDIVELLAGHFQGEEGYESRIASYLLQLQKDGFVRLTVGHPTT